MDNLPELWAHQKYAIERAKELDNLAIFYDTGTGKTRTTLEILRYQFNQNKKILTTLIVCPKSVTHNWKNEIQKYTKIPMDRVTVLEGKVNDRAMEYESDAPKGMIFIANFDGLAYPEFSSKLFKHPPNILIIDESHRCKSSTAKRTKALIKLSKEMEQKRLIHHKYILTGSPVLNNELDLFTQFLILDQGRTFGENFFAFRARYFRDKNEYMPRQKHFPNWVPRDGTTEKLKELMKPVSVTAKKEECIDLPPLVFKEVQVGMSAMQRKAYEQMKKEFIAFVDSGVAVAQLAITKALRMQQILSGHLTKDDGSVYVFRENPRAEVLSDLIEDLVPFEKVIVWAVFKHDHEVIKNICKLQKIPYAEVTGAITDKQAELDKFEKDPECRVMIASQSAGGTGVNMIEASTMIYYSKGYSLEHDLQSQARNYRGGSAKHNKITRIDLVCPGTADEIVNKALRDKHDLASRIVDLKNLL